MRCGSFSLVVVAVAGLSAFAETALDRYVAASDPIYKYELVKVDQPEWRHRVTNIKAARVKHSTGFLFITGGSRQTKPAAQPPATLTSMAAETGTVITELRMVPIGLTLDETV